MENILTQPGFDKLLAALDADREQAGSKYESLRARLIKYFEWRNCATPEELTDTVFDRVVRKISEGEQIRNVEAYSVTIAQFVLKEYLRKIERRNQLVEDALTAQNPANNQDLDETENLRRDCLEKCLAELAPENRRLLVNYFDTDERTMIRVRKRLADALGVSLNNLRIRVCRLKSKLENCTRACCGENKK